MKIRLLAALVAGALSFCLPGSAPQAQNAICPTMPVGDAGNACASDQFVQQAISGGGTGTYSPGQVLGNGTSSPALPAPTQVSPIIDQSIGSTRGSILERGAIGWAVVTPGIAGLPWVSNGTGADPAYQALTTPNVNFTQSGTGAVQRTVDSWLKGNGVHSNDFITPGAVNMQTATPNVTINSGQATLAVSTALFASTDCQGGTGCTGTLGNKAITVGGIGAAGAPLVTTIIGFTDSQHITLGATAGTSLAAISEQIVWGTDNTAALGNWITRCSGFASYCTLDPGKYLVSTSLSTSANLVIFGPGRFGAEITEINPASAVLTVATTTVGPAAHLYGFTLSQYFPAGNVALLALSGTGQRQFGSTLVDLYIFGGQTAVSASNVQYLNIDRNIWIGQTNQGLFYDYPLTCATGIGKIQNSFVAPASGGNGLSFGAIGGFTVINNDISTQGSQVGNGIVFNSTTACASGDVFIDSNNIENWAIGIGYFKGSETSGGSNHISNNDFFNNAQALNLGDANDNWLLDISVHGNNFYCVTTCVTVTTSVRNIAMIGNTFRNMSGTPTGININAAPVTGVVANNTFAGLTTNISNSSTAITGSDVPWRTYTPSLTCGTATFTTNSAKFSVSGKVTSAEIDFTITAIGTCTNTMTFTLPNTPNSGGALNGIETTVNGNAISCSAPSASATSNCRKGGTGANFLVNEHYVASGVYENQ